MVGDFRDVSERLPNDSVDLIFTDPPYDNDSLPYFDDLAQIATRTLVNGGSLISYVPNEHIADVIGRMTVEGLRSYWVCACVHTGKSARMFRKGIVVTWKPMLWFVKGKERFDTSSFVHDGVWSKPEKDAHEWQQGIIEAEHFIRELTPRGGFVFDPFCGSGTTATAAKKLGREWLTCDVDEEHATIARGRISGMDVGNGNGTNGP